MGEAIITRRGGGGGKFERFETIITETGTVSIPCSGLYRITAIGKGESSVLKSTVESWSGYVYYSTADGGCGGGGYLERDISKGAILSVTLATNYIAASLNGTEIIRATNGSDGNAGSASGTGVIAFSSNGKTTKSIVPPDCYNSDRYISKGGIGGSSSSGTSQPTKTGADGGNGLFGGDAPMGGHVIGGTYVTAITPVEEPRNGAGASGAGSTGSGTATSFFAGSGGGGGYGGGAGAASTSGTGGSNFKQGKSGSGGAACVFIERIG